MKYWIESFGSFKGEEYDEIFIEHEDIIISFSDLGARINRWSIPLNETSHESIVLGHENAQQAFDAGEYCYGGTIGRVAGRIGNAEFTLEGRHYQLIENQPPHHLHGGLKGYHLAKWEYNIVESPLGISINFAYVDTQESNGYPGNIMVQVRHTYTQDHEWLIEYKATADETTLFNPTNHVYFNLNGDNSASIKNHYLSVNADLYAPITSEGLPSGELLEVKNTSFDLRKPKLLEEVINAKDNQIKTQAGLDHPFVLKDPGSFGSVAVLSLAEKNRKMVVFTEQPSLVVYTHNFVSSPMEVWGHTLKPYAGVALEAQVLPDAINQKNFGNIILRAGERYSSKTSYHLEL